MNNNTSLSQFTNQYSLSKTLRFELKPIGHTEEWIKKHNIIGVEYDDEEKTDKLVGKDAIIAENYKYVKRMIDAMHRVFIDEALTFHPDAPEKVELGQLIAEFVVPSLNDKRKINQLEPNQQIKEYFKKILDNAAKRWITKFDEEMPGFWDEDIEVLKTKISKATDNKSIKGFNSAIRKVDANKKKGSELLKKTDVGVMFQNEGTIRLLEWKIRRGDVTLSAKELEQGQSEEPMPAKQLVDLLREFNKFFTYFSGFNENRANVYNTKDNIATSLLHRVFSENLPRHLENINKWNTFKRTIEKYCEKDQHFKNFYETKKAEKESQLGVLFDQVFTIPNFNNSIGQSGIDNYNKVIGGLPELSGENEKTQGINELINLCRQQVNGSKNEFPRLKELYKQILSKNDHTFIDVFEDDSSLVSALEIFRIRQFSETEEGKKSFVNSYLDTVEEQLTELKSQKKKITVSKEILSHLSHEMTGYWGDIGEGLLAKYDQTKYKKQKKFTVCEVEEILIEGIENDRFELEANLSADLLDFFKQRLVSLITASKKCWINVENSQLLQTREFEGNRNDENEKRIDQIATVKAFLESCLSISSFIRDWQKDLNSEECHAWSDLLSLFSDNFQVIGLYNMTRNYISQKPYSTEKIKLNFEKTNLLNGWVESITEKSSNGTQYCGYLFRKKNKQFDEYEYFLGISENTKLFLCFKKDEISDCDKSDFERLDYYQAKSTTYYGPFYSGEKAKLIHLFREKIKAVLMSNKVNSIVTQKLNKIFVGDDPTPSGVIAKIQKDKDLHDVLVDPEVIACCNSITQQIKEYVSGFVSKTPSLRSVAENDYEGTSGIIQLTKDIQRIAKTSKLFEFFPVSQSEFNWVANDKEKPLFLFRISNKDLNFCDKATSGERYLEKRGRENLHTIFFRALMSADQSVFDLGSAEIFYRKSSIKIPEKKKDFGYHAKELDGKFDYPIFKNRRFSENKYLFHLSTSFNYVASDPIPKDKFKPSFNLKFNEKIRGFLKDNKEVKIIGIDRGEKHLLYYSLIDQKGNILKQGSWNKISNGFIPKGQTEERLIDYKANLNKKEKDRDKARKSWSRIENIKDFKSGYLSQIVHLLAKMIVEENAIVVLEDLNLGFKRSRFGIEKQVYQKFEKALIDKLNFLVFKDQKDSSKAGHLLNAYQLSGAYHQDSLRSQKQSGILFYTTASYTSTTDPVSGFLKNVYSSYQNVDQAVQFWRSFDKIVYNGTKQRFEFTYTLGKIASKSMEAEDKESDVLEKKWTVCSCVERSKYTRYEKLSETERKEVDEQNVGKKGKHDIFIVTQKIKETLENAGVILTDGLDVKALLESKTNKSDATLHKSMIYAFNSILTMRVTDPNYEVGTSENDFILSPVEPFYDSRKLKNANDQTPSLPENGDANGAYNIARKGLCIFERINNDDDNLVIDKKTWQNSVQGKGVVELQNAKWEESLKYYDKH